jgi:outer membrane protein OmpA-like peptidoglycan-associated protein
MIKHLLLLSILVIIALLGFSQSENLVLNPGFEEYDKCPENYTYQDKSHKLIPNWGYPTLATPDYFNRCGKGVVAVPSNFAGVSQPNSGDAYMGSILSGSEKNYREYFQGELSQPLVAGKRYCVTFWYRLASYSKFAVDQMSIRFYNAKLTSESKNPIGGKPQLNNTSGLFLDNTTEWKQMCWVFTATGGEHFFVVGNFKNYDNTNYVVTGKDVMNKKGKEYAYYFFDDFSVRELIDCSICPCLPHGLETFIIDSSYTGGKNPITGEVRKIINDGKIKIGIRGGQEPYIIEWSNGAKNVTELKNLPGGMYMYKVTDQNSCIDGGEVTFEEPELTSDDLEEGLKNIKEGSAIVLENIFFQTGKTELLPQSFPELDKVYAFMTENNIKLIEISGHTDNVGSAAVNKKLSQGRAEAVVDYLVSKGIATERLLAVGNGLETPIETNLSEDGKAQNRRVEFKLLRK